jgi:hypothetical protein
VTAPTRPRRASPDPLRLAGPPPAEEETAGARAGGPGPVASARCVCGHLDVFHNLGTRAGAEVRTGCSTSDGRDATPCGCPLYQEAS